MTLVGSQNGKRVIFSQTAPTEARDKILWMPLNASNNPIDGQLNWWNGSVWTKFSKVGGSRFLYSTATSVSMQAAGTDLQILSPITLPANTVPVGGALRLHWMFKATTSSNSKTFTVKLGSATVVSLAQTSSNLGVGSRLIFNRDNTTALAITNTATLGEGTPNSNPQSGAVDWTVDQSISVLTTIAVAANGIDLYYFAVELY